MHLDVALLQYTHLTSLDIQRLRNINATFLLLTPGVNLIVGPNGSGKTSVCEAISLLFHGRSFRAASPFSILIQNQAQALQIQAKLCAKDQQTIRIIMRRPLRGHWYLKVDDTKKDRLQDVTRLLPLKILAPEFENLVDTGSKERRQFLDWLLFHVEPTFAKEIAVYNNALKQRNQCLSNKSVYDEELEFWSQQLVEAGTIIYQRRSSILKLLVNVLRPLLQGTPYGGIDVALTESWLDATDFKAKLFGVRREEFRRQRTLVGPHRTDVVLTQSITGKCVTLKAYYSRGQKKSIGLFFTIAAIQLLNELKGQKVLLVIDDWRAELDEASRTLLLSKINELRLQVVLTSTELEDRLVLPAQSKVFQINQGQINEYL